MMTGILVFLVGLGLLPAILGLLVIYHVFGREKRGPADRSNRINHLRLVWFALTREDRFVGVFPWLRHDEWNNMEDRR